MLQIFRFKGMLIRSWELEERAETLCGRRDTLGDGTLFFSWRLFLVGNVLEN